MKLNEPRVRISDLGIDAERFSVLWSGLKALESIIMTGIIRLGILSWGHLSFLLLSSLDGVGLKPDPKIYAIRRKRREERDAIMKEKENMKGKLQLDRVLMHVLKNRSSSFLFLFSFLSFFLYVSEWAKSESFLKNGHHQDAIRSLTHHIKEGKKTQWAPVNEREKTRERT